MATHSSILAQRIPWTEEPGGIQSVQFSSVQFSHSVLANSLQPHESQHIHASLSITNSRSLLKLMPIELLMPSSHLILCHPLLLLLPIPPSIRVFSNESTLRIRWPKCQSFSFSISPSNEHPGLISIRMDWLDVLAGQGTLKSLLQHHSSKASIFWHSTFFTVQLSHPYITTGKTIAYIGYSQWGHKELDRTEKLTLLLSFPIHSVSINYFSGNNDITFLISAYSFFGPLIHLLSLACNYSP